MLPICSTVLNGREYFPQFILSIICKRTEKKQLFICGMYIFNNLKGGAYADTQCYWSCCANKAFPRSNVK